VKERDRTASVLAITNAETPTDTSSHSANFLAWHASHTRYLQQSYDTQSRSPAAGSTDKTPQPALSEHFPYISSKHRASIFPSANGETIPALHDRYAYALHRIISALDADPAGPKTALLCTHAAGMICIGRALTGRMPEKEEEEDFNCGTCSLSVFKRRKTPSRKGEADARKEQEEEEIVEEWDERQPDHIPRVAWRDGKGIMGGWECTVNGDCSHLTNGEERSWSVRSVCLLCSLSLFASDCNVPVILQYSLLQQSTNLDFELSF